MFKLYNYIDDQHIKGNEMRIIDHSDLIQINETQFVRRTPNGPQYFIKTKCSNCDKEIFRRAADLKTTQNSFCSVICKKAFRIKNNLNKQYEVGKEYPTQTVGTVRIFSGSAWSYRKKYICEQCGKSIKREFGRKRSGSHHFCSRKCDYTFYNTKESEILTKRDTNEVSGECAIFPEPSTPPVVPLSNLPHNETSIRFKDHLAYDYPTNSRSNELKNISTQPGDFNSTAFYNKNVLSFQSHYYETEKRMWLENMGNLRDKLLANRLKYIGKNEYQINDKEILRGFKISGIHIGFTHFNPLWIKAFIEKYNIESLYDPTMGWGHRLLGAQNIKYIGNDLDIRTYNGCCEMIKDLGLANKFLYNNNSASFIPSEEYEAVFTCPPYFNTEIYNNKAFKTLDDYAQWWERTIKCSLKPAVKYFAYVINTEYKTILHDICIRNGLGLSEIIELGKKTNHFQRVEGTKVVKGEFLYVFKPSNFLQKTCSQSINI